MGGAGVGGWGCRGGGHYFFRVLKSLEGCDGWGEGRGILYIKASVIQWKNIRPWRPELGLKEDILFLEIVNFYIFGGAAKLRWAGGRAAPRWAWQ
jgi:hypothetical protein